MLVDRIDDGLDALRCRNVPLDVVVSGQDLQELQALFNDVPLLKKVPIGYIIVIILNRKARF